MHVDNRYVRRGAIDPAGLLQAEDVTDAALGRHCHQPYECILRPRCAAFLPEHDVTQLYKAGKDQIYALNAQGITALADVPVGDLKAAHLVQREAVLTGQRVVLVEPLRRWLAGLEYPLHCLDFETMNPALPLVDGTRPYQQYPSSSRCMLSTAREPSRGMSSIWSAPRAIPGRGSSRRCGRSTVWPAGGRSWPTTRRSSGGCCAGWLRRFPSTRPFSWLSRRVSRT